MIFSLESQVVRSEKAGSSRDDNVTDCLLRVMIKKGSTCDYEVAGRTGHMSVIYFSYGEIDPQPRHHQTMTHYTRHLQRNLGYLRQQFATREAVQFGNSNQTATVDMFQVGGGRWSIYAEPLGHLGLG